MFKCSYTMFQDNDQVSQFFCIITGNCSLFIFRGGGFCHTYGDVRILQLLQAAEACPMEAS